MEFTVHDPIILGKLAIQTTLCVKTHAYDEVSSSMYGQLPVYMFYISSVSLTFTDTAAEQSDIVPDNCSVCG